jgi:hypothetical protein
VPIAISSVRQWIVSPYEYFKPACFTEIDAGFGHYFFWQKLGLKILVSALAKETEIVIKRHRFTLTVSA